MSSFGTSILTIGWIWGTLCSDAVRVVLVTLYLDKALESVVSQMDSRSYIRKNWLGILGIIIGIAGILATTILYLRSRTRRQPVFIVDLDRTRILSAERVSEAPIRVIKKHGGTEIKSDLTAVKIYFWNRGREPIKRENILQEIRIILDDPEGEIIDFKVLKISRDVTDFRVAPDSMNPRKVLSVDFLILEHNDGATCQIIYEGDPGADFTISGIIEGTDRIGTASSAQHIILLVTYAKYVVFALLFLMCAWVFRIAESKFEEHKEKTVTHKLASLLGSMPVQILGTIAVVMFFAVLGYLVAKEESEKEIVRAVPSAVLPGDIIPERHLVLIPTASFEMGTDHSEVAQVVRWAEKWSSRPNPSEFEDETPRHTVNLGAFYIDKYEVTNAQYAKFLNEYGKNTDADRHKLLNIDSEHCLIERMEARYRPKPGHEDHPVVMVSWYGATAYAQSHGKRLPTEAEWEEAARGGFVDKMFPWGNAELNGTQCNFEDKTTTYDDGYQFTAPVGSYPPNGYGLYDMAGNVWEWCADWYDSSYYAKSPGRSPTGPSSGSGRVVRGGSWNNDATYLRVADRYAKPENYTSYGGGFRCVQDISP